MCPLPVIVDLRETRSVEEEPEEVRAAFRLLLPFRLRVGEFSYHACTSAPSFEVLLHNPIAVADEPSPEDLDQDALDRGGYRTDAVVVLAEPGVSRRDLLGLRGVGEVGLESNRRCAEAARRAVNDLVVAYATATGAMDGAGPLTLLRPWDFANATNWSFFILLEPQASVGPERLRELITREPFVWLHASAYGPLADAPEAQLRCIGDALERQRQMVFYEFAFLARSYLDAESGREALVLAVTALESAMAELLRLEVAPRLGDLGNLPKREGEGRITPKWLTRNLMREQGVHTMQYVLPYLAMRDEERPSPEIIQACADGIEKRNGIVHGKSEVKGTEDAEYSAACRAVLDTYECYRHAVEARASAGG